MIQVSIDEIREGGLTKDEAIPLELLQETLGGDRDTGFLPAGPSQLHATFQKVSGGVLVHGEFTVPLKTACNRCLADVPVSVPVEFTLQLVPESQVALAAEGEGEDDEGGEEGGSFGLGDADREPFDGKTIKLDPIVREQVLLALPMHAVCRDDCRGLCDLCGKNLNEGNCGCDRRQVDPRMAALKDIKLS
jgi:uncharacterized protein